MHRFLSATALLGILLGSSPVTAESLMAHTPQEMKLDAQKHRAMAQAHEAMAKCLEEAKSPGYKSCLVNLQAMCRTCHGQNLRIEA